LAPKTRFDGRQGLRSMSDGDDLSATKKLMGALGRMPPKQHKKMKLGKTRHKKRRSKKTAK
jgi:hypothetical protein